MSRFTNFASYCILCEVLSYVCGTCYNGHEGHVFRLLNFHTIDTPSNTYTDIPSMGRCLSLCSFDGNGGLFKHDIDTGFCECFNLPQTLTNVENAAPMWIAGKCLTLSNLGGGGHTDPSM